VPYATTIEKEAGALMLHMGEHAAKLPEVLLTERERAHNRLSATFDAKCAYLALHGSWPHSYKVTSLNLQSGDILWRSDVWANDSSIGYEGLSPPHCVTLIRKADKLFVFGLGNASIYIETFTAKDGKNLFRFSTYY
jgi:hypothetical protein